MQLSDRIAEEDNLCTVVEERRGLDQTRCYVSQPQGEDILAAVQLLCRGMLSFTASAKQPCSCSYAAARHCNAEQRMAAALEGPKETRHGGLARDR